MARFNVTSPDGQKFVVTAPDDASPDQVMEFARSQWKEPAKKPSATDEMSGAQTLAAGIGRGMTAAGRAAAGFIGDTPLGSLNRAVHSVLPNWVPGRLPTASESEAARAEAERIDAPLLQTRSGKVGNVIGSAVAASPALLVPGANTYLGSALIGAGTGAVTTEGGSTDRLAGAGFGALGGLVGKGLGDAIGTGVSKLASWASSRQAAAKAANAGRDAAVANAQQAGYVLPPTEANPGILNSALEGLSGKIKTSQAASAKNQTVTNNLAKKAIGLPEDAPITIDALNSVRSAAGQAYEAVASTGQIKPTQAYNQALDDIVAPFKKAAAGFPNAKPNPIIAEIESLRSPEFDAGAAIAKIRELRDAADSSYRAGSKDAGKAFKSAATALEDAIETHLTQVKAPPGMLDSFRDARKLIAKTYTVQKGLNAQTGDVAAPALAKELAKGKPLSGELRTIGEAGLAFPKATQALQQNYNTLSPLDYLAAIATGNPLVAGARPAARSLVLSRPYQATMAGPRTYEDATGLNALRALLENDYVRRLGVSGAGAALPASQQ